MEVLGLALQTIPLHEEDESSGSLCGASPSVSWSVALSRGTTIKGREEDTGSKRPNEETNELWVWMPVRFTFIEMVGIY